MSGKPTVSIVIRSCNEEQHIGRLLAGVLRQTIRDIQIIIVDSGSTDATLAIAERFPVEVISIDPKDFSFGRSLNRGCEAARGDYIVIASAHVYPVRHDWIEKLLAPFSDPDVALVYGKQRGNPTTKYSERQIFEQWFPNRSNPKQDHPFCNNANSAIRRDDWETQPYDENLTGLEDLSWARGMMRAGYRVAYNAEAEVIHVHDESMGQVLRRYMREAIALRQIVPEEAFTTQDLLRLLPANIWHDWQAAARDGVLLQKALEIVGFRIMQFWGTYRGFSKHGPVTSSLKEKFYYPKRVRGELPERSQSREDRRIDYSTPTE